MKLFWVVFLASVTANGALLLALRMNPAAPVATFVEGVHRPTSGRTDHLAKASGGTQGWRTEGSGSRANSWAELASENPAVFAGRLRAAGFPPHVVHAVISHVVNEQFLARREELLEDNSMRSFWKPTRNVIADTKKQAALRQLDRERDRLLRQLAGEEGWDDELQQVYLRRQYGDLSPDKLARLQDVLDDYEALRAEMRPAAGAVTDRRLEEELRNDLAKFLTREELAEYDRRNSRTAHELRKRLDTFGATEEEYRTIFDLTRAREELAARSKNGSSAQQSAARRAAEQELQRQLKERLGPDRYADYQQATNGAHTALNRIAARFELPVSAARQVVAMERDFSKRAATVRSDREMSPDQKAARLALLRQEATEKLAATLTPRGMEAYRSREGGWLDRLTASPTTRK